MTALTDPEADLRALLRDLPAYAVPARLQQVSTVLRVEQVRKRQVMAAAAAQIADGRVELLDSHHTPSPEVTLRAAPEVLAAVLRGELNSGLEYVRGSLDIHGDTAQALAVGAMIRRAGTCDTPVDPRALDPVEVAGALGEVSRDHLRSVMRSGFRGVVLDEIFRRLPDHISPRRAARVRLVVGFRLTGSPSGEIERYVVSVHDGAATVAVGDTGAGERDATVTCEGHDFLKLATGHLNPVIGVLRGHLKVKGDQGKALQLSSVIDIPRAG